MISIIICSINKDLARQVQKSIADTIGVLWEAIVIDNSAVPVSLTEVYNKGAAQASYDVLCFLHEDVLLQTKDWGVILINHFKNDPLLGLIGIAGSKYKSKTPSGWHSGIPAMECCNIKHVNNAGKEDNLYLNPVPGSLVQEVVVLDGVLLCCTKKVWEEVKFDTTLLKGFHLYDLDFSLRVAQRYKVIVTFEINLIHLTQGGSFGDSWVDYTLRWHNKMKNYLPAVVAGIPFNEWKFDNKILKRWLIRLKHENISLHKQFQWLWHIQIWKHISAWPYVFLFLVKKYFKKSTH